MDEELTTVNENEKETEPSALSRILLVVKRNILLILIIVAIGIGAGVLIAYLKKPVYTATNVVTFTAASTSSEKQSITSNIDFMTLNFKSVVDFCRSDVVADRADFYYANLLKERETKPSLSVNEYLKALEIYEDTYKKQAEYGAYTYSDYYNDKVTSSKGYVELYGEDKTHADEYVDLMLSKDLNVSYGVFRYFFARKKANASLTLENYMAYYRTFDGTHYTPSATLRRQYVNTENITSFSSMATGATAAYINFFTITYKDYGSQTAREKLSVIDFAAEEEINAGFGAGSEEYFNGIRIAIKPSEDPTIASDTSKRRIVLIAALVGVVVAGVAVYIKHLFDTTVKDKNELEKLTGTTVLAYIADREV